VARRPCSRSTHRRCSSAMGPGSVNFAGTCLCALRALPVTPFSSGDVAAHSGVSAPLTGPTSTTYNDKSIIDTRL
jgi:hypothetical protein